MLQDEAVRSAQIYLDYLNAHKDDGLGMVRARVKSIQSSLLSKEIVMTMDRIRIPLPHPGCGPYKEM